MDGGSDNQAAGRMPRLLPEALVGLAAVAANWPILRSFFFQDDFANLFELANFGLKDFVTAPASGHMYMVRNTVFYLTFVVFRMNSTAYYAIALATHVANALLLLTLVRRLTNTPWLAWFGATLFAVVPTDVGTLGWYSVYGHALATTFMLAGLLLLVPRREAERPTTLPEALGAAGCLVAASQSFGTAAAVAVLLPLLALLLHSPVRRSRAVVAALWLAPVSVGIAWWAMYSTETRLNPQPEYQVKMMIALAMFYAKVATMLLHILSLGVVSFLLGAWYPLARYPDAISTTVVGSAGLALVLTLAFGSSWTRRNVAAFFLVAFTAYAAIAAGRATLFFATRPKDLLQAWAGATRYHYLAQASLAVVLCLMVQEAIRCGQEFGLGMRPLRVLLTGWGIAVVAASGLLRSPTDDYRSERRQVDLIRDAIAAEVAQHPRGSAVCVPNRAASLAFGFPGWVGVFMLYNPGEELDGRRVYFTTSDPATLALLGPEGGRIRRLLLPDGACPPGQGRGPT